MKIINLTPHSIQVYGAEQFINLEQTNATTWIADGVTGAPLHDFPSEGSARIATKTKEKIHPIFKGIYAETEYGEAEGLPEVELTAVGVPDMLIVSLPMKSMSQAAMHPMAKFMVCPYKVVRSRQNGSLVLGCMGLSL